MRDDEASTALIMRGRGRRLRHPKRVIGAAAPSWSRCGMQKRPWWWHVAGATLEPGGGGCVTRR
jgi:hypothetical protein